MRQKASNTGKIMNFETAVNRIHCYTSTQIRACDWSKSLYVFCLNDWMIFVNFLLFWFWGITKQIVTSVSIIIENFWPLVRKMLISIYISGNILQTFGSKMFNDNLDASHYLYNVQIFKKLTQIVTKLSCKLCTGGRVVRCCGSCVVKKSTAVR